MNANNIMEWKQTAPGIWTIVPDGERSPAKRPARKIASLMANQVPPETARPAGKPRSLPSLSAAART